MLRMQHLDGSSIGATLLTGFFGWLAHVTKSDLATAFTIVAAITTIAVNIKKLRKK